MIYTGCALYSISVLAEEIPSTLILVFMDTGRGCSEAMIRREIYTSDTIIKAPSYYHLDRLIVHVGMGSHR